MTATRSVIGSAAHSRCARAADFAAAATDAAFADAGRPEHVARGRLDRLDRLGRVDPAVAEDLARPVLLAEEILNGLLDRAHDTRSSASWVSGLRSLIRSAAFSAIMIVAAFVLARVIVGITDASTTRRPSMP